MTVWDLRGTPAKQRLVREALAACDFPFDLMAPSLAGEGKTAIAVDWEDLSRFATAAKAGHGHDGGAHTIVREVEGRARVLGLFYLPPYTRVVLDVSLTGSLAHEVFLAEAAHAIDYHYMTPVMRLAVWDALHAVDLPAGTVIPESGDVDHGHSWFDGPGGYGTWVGEAFMEAFVEAFAPSVPVTITLAHPTAPAAAHSIREALMPIPATPVPDPPTDTPADPPGPPDALVGALSRFVATKGCPDYLRDAATPWLSHNH